MTTSSQCNTGRMCVTLPLITKGNTSLAVHVVQKITIIRVLKSPLGVVEILAENSPIEVNC